MSQEFDQLQQRLAEIARQQQQQQIRQDQSRIQQEQQFQQGVLGAVALIEQIPAQEETRGREQVQQLSQEARVLRLGEMATSIRDQLWRITAVDQISLTEVAKPKVKVNIRFNSEKERMDVSKIIWGKYTAEQQRIDQMRYGERDVKFLGMRIGKKEQEFVGDTEAYRSANEKHRKLHGRLMELFEPNTLPPQTNNSYAGWLLSYPCWYVTEPYEEYYHDNEYGTSLYYEPSHSNETRNELFFGIGYVTDESLIIPEARALVSKEQLPSGVKAYLVVGSAGDLVSHRTEGDKNTHLYVKSPGEYNSSVPNSYYNKRPYESDFQAIPVTYPGSQQKFFDRIAREAERLSPVNFPR